MSALKTDLTAELSYSTSATVRWQISLHDLTRQHSISGLIRATLVSGFGLKSYSYSFKLGLLCVLFWQVWRTKEKHLCYRVLSTTRNHVNMEWYRWMLHESKTKRNAFPYLGKHASEAFNLIFTLSNHFTHFWPFQYFSRYSVYRYFVTRYVVTSLLCLVTPFEYSGNFLTVCDAAKKNKIYCFLTSYTHQFEFFLLIFFILWPFSH